jgi:hypothetical protein
MEINIAIQRKNERKKRNVEKVWGEKMEKGAL